MRDPINRQSDLYKAMRLVISELMFERCKTLGNQFIQDDILALKLIIEDMEKVLNLAKLADKESNT